MVTLKENDCNCCGISSYKIRGTGIIVTRGLLESKNVCQIFLRKCSILRLATDLLKITFRSKFISEKGIADYFRVNISTPISTPSFRFKDFKVNHFL